MDTEKEYRALVEQCAAQGRALAGHLANNGLLEPLYLYARPSAPGKPGRLMLVRDGRAVPDGVQLVTGEGLRANIPRDAYFTWIYERARRAPILSVD